MQATELHHAAVPVHLACPIDDLARARRWLAWALRDPYSVPSAPWIDLIAIAGDDPAAREIAIQRSVRMSSRGCEVWLCGGSVTIEMERQARYAASTMSRVYDLSDLGPEPPAAPPPPQPGLWYSWPAVRPWRVWSDRGTPERGGEGS